MRVLICIALSFCGAVQAESAAIPVKARAAMDKLDAQISVLNHDVRQNALKQAEFKTKVETLREKVNAANDPANRERLEKALANHKEQLRFYEKLIAEQRRTIDDLMTERRFLSGAHSPESIADRDKLLGVEHKKAVPVDLPESQPVAAKRDKRSETEYPIDIGYYEGDDTPDPLRDSMHHKKK